MPWSLFSECWALSQLFHSSLSLSFKRLFSSSSLYAIRVVSSAYLRLLIFLPAILIPACTSSSPAFLMMYSAYKLDKQGDNIQPWHTPFPIWNQSVVHVQVWLLLLDLYIGFSSVQETGIPVHLTCLLRNLYAGQETIVRTRHGTTDWIQSRK